MSTCPCALALYMIYVKPVLPHGWGYNCYLSLSVIHSALELCGYGGKVTIYLRNGKGNGEFILREVGDGNVKRGLYIKKSQLHL